MLNFTHCSMLIRIGQCFGSDSLNVVLSREEAQVCGFWLILHEGQIQSQTLLIPSQMQETFDTSLNCEIRHPNMCSYYLVRVHTQLNLFAGNKISKESHKTSSGNWCIELVAWFFQTTSRFEKWFMPICRVVRFTLWNFYAIKVSMLPLFLDCGLILLACCVGQYGLGPFSRAVQQEDSLVVNISKL